MLLNKSISQVSQHENQVSQHEIPATEGQEVANLSLIGNIGRRSKKKTSIFEYDDDVIPQQETCDQQWNELYHEVNHYKNIRMKKEEKENTNVLTW